MEVVDRGTMLNELFMLAFFGCCICILSNFCLKPVIFSGGGVMGFFELCNHFGSLILVPWSIHRSMCVCV